LDIRQEDKLTPAKQQKQQSVILMGERGQLAKNLCFNLIMEFSLHILLLLLLRSHLKK
jgi:hypothetical protein